MKAMLPENEAQRLDALRRYQILDNPSEPAFDRIAEMAANIFHVPTAGISPVDEDRVWIKARVGTNVDQVAREADIALRRCSRRAFTTCAMPLMTSAHSATHLLTILASAFLLQAPLRTNDGFDLGTVWVLDQKPRDLRTGEADMLRALAALEMNQMELRQHTEEMTRLERALRTMAEKVEAEIRDRFFSSLARSMAQALEVAYAFVTCLSDGGSRFKILAI
jgi:hypothetical protein